MQKLSLFPVFLLTFCSKSVNFLRILSKKGQKTLKTPNNTQNTYFPSKWSTCAIGIIYPLGSQIIINQLETPFCLFPWYPESLFPYAFFPSALLPFSLVP